MTYFNNLKNSHLGLHKAMVKQNGFIEKTTKAKQKQILKLCKYRVRCLSGGSHNDLYKV